MSTATHSSPLSAQQIADYKRDGYVVVKGLYDADTMAQWKTILNEALTAQMDFNPAGVVVWSPQNIHPVMLEAMRDPFVTPILNQLIGPNLEFLSAKAVYKNSKTIFGSPFHQDWFYWNGESKISVWIALDDATAANGCLIFVPGTHTRVFPMESDTTTSRGFTNTISDSNLAGLPRVTLDVKRGDAVFFHDLAVHGSHENTSRADRWSLISTYRDASVVDPSLLETNLWKEPLLISGQSVNRGVRR